MDAVGTPSNLTAREREVLSALRSLVDVEREEAARWIRDEPCARALIDALGDAALSDLDPTVRYFAVQTPRIGLEVLASVLDRDRAQSVRREAARRLFSHAHDSTLAERYLVQALHDADFEVRQHALSRLDSEPDLVRRGHLVPTLIALLDDADQAIRALAARALGSAKASAIDALPRLRAILADGEHIELDLREEVTRALQRIEASFAAAQRKLQK